MGVGITISVFLNIWKKQTGIVSDEAENEDVGNPRNGNCLPCLATHATVPLKRNLRFMDGKVVTFCPSWGSPLPGILAWCFSYQPKSLLPPFLLPGKNCARAPAPLRWPATCNRWQVKSEPEGLCSGDLLGSQKLTHVLANVSSVRNEMWISLRPGLHD